MNQDKSTVSNADILDDLPTPVQSVAIQPVKSDVETMMAEIQRAAGQNPDRNPDGTFAKGNGLSVSKSHSPAKRVAALFRGKLAGRDTLDPSGRAELESIFLNMVAIAKNTDPKSRKEAVWAFNAIMDRAFGPAPKSDEELDAMREAGQVRVVVLTQPMLLEAKDKPLLKPAEFIDVEVEPE